MQIPHDRDYFLASSVQKCADRRNPSTGETRVKSGTSETNGGSRFQVRSSMFLELRTSDRAYRPRPARCALEKPAR